MKIAAGKPRDIPPEKTGSAELRRSLAAPFITHAKAWGILVEASNLRIRI